MVSVNSTIVSGLPALAGVTMDMVSSVLDLNVSGLPLERLRLVPPGWDGAGLSGLRRRPLYQRW